MIKVYRELLKLIRLINWWRYSNNAPNWVCDLICCLRHPLSSYIVWDGGKVSSRSKWDGSRGTSKLMTISVYKFNKVSLDMLSAGGDHANIMLLIVDCSCLACNPLNWLGEPWGRWGETRRNKKGFSVDGLNIGRWKTTWNDLFDYISLGNWDEEGRSCFSRGPKGTALMQSPESAQLASGI